MAVVVPAYRCRPWIEGVVRDLSQHIPDATIIVVDDGSDDGTGELARRAGAIVLSHPTNRGKGSALRTGFAEALRRRCRAVVTVDGDGQHRAEDAAKVLALVVGGKADLVLGNRMHNPGRMPRDRWLSNSLSSLVVSVACQRRIRDAQCGLRAVSAQLLQQLPLRSRRFEIESEMILLAAKAGARIASRPVASVYDEGDGNATSHIARARDTLRFLRLIFSHFLRWS